MRVGYARVSTTDQDIESQLARLADCDKVFYEKWSGSKKDRAQLVSCLEFVREGDTLVCTRLDRLARSVSHLCEIAQTLQRKGVGLLVLDQSIDLTGPTGRLMFHMLAAIAEFELGLRKQAQIAGVEHARATGVHLGRPVVLSPVDLAELERLMATGMQVKQAARLMHVCESTARRALKRKRAYATTF